MSKRIWIMGIILLCIMFTVGFVINNYKETQNQENEAFSREASEREARENEDKAKADEALKKAEEEASEKARIKAEEEAKEAERLRIRAAQIEENTVHIMSGGSNLLDTPDKNAKVLDKLSGKVSVFVVNTISDEEGTLKYYEVKNDIDATSSMGFIKVSDTVKSLKDFIAKPISDVDYDPFMKHEAKGDIDVKGIFVTGHTAQSPRMDELITLIEETELNAMVIDVKDDNGFMLYYSEAAERYNPIANEHYYVEDIVSLIKRLKEKNIYLIARIVTFKSPLYAKTHPERAIVYRESGKLYSDGDRLIWASPHDRILWDYNIAVAKEAAAYGFDEVQFDYVRFPAIANQKGMDYRNENGESQTAAIQNFLKAAYEALREHEVVISADVFGWAASALDDVGIGQHWEAITNVVDVISPMMYPSHYGPGNFGLPVPDAFPYETIDRSIKAAISRNDNVYTPGRIRPWIQDFTASWVSGHIRYGAKEVKAQIDALKANGIEEYLLWNAGNYYSKNALK